RGGHDDPRDLRGEGRGRLSRPRVEAAAGSAATWIGDRAGRRHRDGRRELEGHWRALAIGVPLASLRVDLDAHRAGRRPPPHVGPAPQRGRGSLRAPASALRAGHVQGRRRPLSRRCHHGRARPVVRLIVDTSGGTYPVHIGRGALKELKPTLARLDPTGVVIVADENVRGWAQLVAKTVKSARLKPAVHVVPASERSKSLTAL